MDFSNMRTLDVSHNKLTVVNLDNLLALTNLRKVQFANNPLVSTTAGDNKLRQDHLSEVDISNTRLVTLNTTAFFKYIDLKVGVLKDALFFSILKVENVTFIESGLLYSSIPVFWDSKVCFIAHRRIPQQRQ